MHQIRNPQDDIVAMQTRRFGSVAWGWPLFIAVVAGWTAFDLSLVAVSGQPDLVLKLLPGYAGVLLAGAVVGLFCAFDRRIFWTCFAVTAAAAIALKFSRSDVAWHLICLPRATVLLFAACLAARSIAQRWGRAVWPGGGLGAIAAAVFASYVGTVTPFAVIAVIAGALLVASSAVGTARLRRMTTAAALVIALALVAAFAHQNAQLPRADRPHTGAASTPTPGPNLIVMVLDTVSAHHLAPYGYGRVTTPGLDAFVRENAIRYTQARSASSWTLPSHASIFTGLYPSEHGADRLISDHGEPSDRSPAGRLGLWPVEPLRSDVTTLAERLAAAGYQTGAVVANSGYLSHEFGIDRGFEHYDDRAGFSSLLLLQLVGFQEHLRKGTRSAETITDRAIRWIDAPERRRPFFLFLNYMDAHAPYVPPRPYDRVFDGEPPGDPLMYEHSFNALLYDRELRYLDTQLTRLLRALEARSLLTDTVLIITADHGEAFGEHGFWKHDQALYEELIHVPLYVKPVGPPRPGVSDGALTSPDLYRLMLAELGLPDASTNGDSSIVAEWYQPDETTAAAITKRDAAPVPLDRDLVVWFDAGLKWIVSSKGAVEAYDLHADPGELHPLDVSMDQIEQARARARAWWDAHPPVARAERTSPALDPAVIERLRNLGYVH